MIRFKTYRFSERAVSQARALGIFGDTRLRLARMLKRSAPFTSQMGNRRFQAYVFTVQDDLVTWIDRMEPAEQAA